MKLEANTTITARCITDSTLVFKATVISRKGDFITFTLEGQTKVQRCKVKQDCTGEEYAYCMGKYSMAPVFRAR